MPCLFLNPSGVLAENHPKNRGFVGILRGQKCLKRRFSRRSPVGEWSRGARSMPRVFGRGSRSQAAALVSDRDDAALFPAIRILQRYGSAKSGRARRVRAACRRRGDPKRSSTICCRSFGLRARPSKAGPSRVPHSGGRSRARPHALSLATEFLVCHWRQGALDAVLTGMPHGIFCLGCCWLLMALLFAWCCWKRQSPEVGRCAC